MKEHAINIRGGEVEFIHDDALAQDLEPAFGFARPVRASHVEPHPTKPGWVADMRPSTGPVLGDKTTFTNVSSTLQEVPVEKLGRALDGIVPFATREEALAAEVAWLQKEKGL